MNLRLGAANLYDLLQRKGRMPGEHGPSLGADRFCDIFATIVVITLLYVLQTCAQAEQNRVVQPSPGHTIADHRR